MHPEITQGGPGQCPRCGMALALKNEAPKRVHETEDRGLGLLTWRNYVPLIVIISLLLLVSAVLSVADYSRGGFNVENSIIYFMIGFFIVFAGFKLMDLKGFAEGYSTYDLLAQKWFGYGYAYPFIELGFGLAMLLGFHDPSLLWAEVVVMTFSGIGVAVKLARGEEFQCACLGTFLKVPLTKITIIEDFGMAALALILLY